MARALSMTIARTHPTALAVHSGNVTRTPRPEHAGEKEWIRLIDRRLYRVLLRHGCYRPELERAGVPPPEAGNQLRFCMSPEQLLVEGDERIRSPLRGKVEPVEPGDETVGRGPCAGVQAVCRHLEPGQLDCPKAAERVMEALDQRRQHHSRFEGALTYPKRGVVETWTRRGRDLDSLKFTYLQPDLHKSNP